MKRTLVVLTTALLVLTAQLSLAFDVHTKVNVTTASTQVLAATDRATLLLENISDVKIWCTLDGSTAVVGQGVEIQPVGGSLFIDKERAVPLTAIKCIHNSSGNKVILATQLPFRPY